MTTYLTAFTEIKDFDPSIVVNPDSLDIRSAIYYSNHHLDHLWFRGIDGRLYKGRSAGFYGDSNIRTSINNVYRVLTMPDSDPIFTFDARFTLKSGTIIDYHYIYDKNNNDEDESLGSADIYERLKALPELLNALTDLGFDPDTSNIDSGYNSDVYKKEWKLRTKLNLDNYCCVCFSEDITYYSTNDGGAGCNIEVARSFPVVVSWVDRVYV